MKEILMDLSKSKAVYVFKLNTETDFWLRLVHTYQIFPASEIYMNHY